MKFKLCTQVFLVAGVEKVKEEAKKLNKANNSARKKKQYYKRTIEQEKP